METTNTHKSCPGLKLCTMCQIEAHAKRNAALSATCICGADLKYLNVASDTPKCVSCGWSPENCLCAPNP